MMKIKWTFQWARTRLVYWLIGSFPRDTSLTIVRTGSGCPRHHQVVAAGASPLRHLLRAMRGRRYRAGDRLLITLTASGYLPERIRITIRDARNPRATLLPG